MKLYLLVIFLTSKLLLAQWVNIPIPPLIKSIESIQIIEDSILYAVGIDSLYYSARRSYLLKTADLGESWEIIQFPNYALEINKISFLDGQNGIAVGNLKSQSKSIILRTTNGGENWSVGWDTPDTLITVVPDLKYVNDNMCLAVVRCYYKDYSLFLVSNDGGHNYITKILPKAGLTNISISKDSVCYISGGEGENNYGDIFKTKDWGITLESVLTPEYEIGYGFKNILTTLTEDGNKIIIGGTTSLMDYHNPYLFQSIDQGNTWERKNLDFKGSFNTLVKDFTDNKWYLAYSTSTLGENWIHRGYILSFGENFSDVDTMDISNNEGTIYEILISDKIKIANIHTGILILKSDTNFNADNKLNASFNLYQNYPNPFNPSTKIRYTIQNQENVELKVYDILGREIAVLVDGIILTGTYEIEFNPSADGLNLPSGIYFYKLKAGKYSETKKMVLLQ